ncbi:MAG: nucleotide exchange factor GrpE [Chloroflexi bacterium]|nr:nucleotide exchange factor GrpE [Chloroflexota bacterium]
MTERQNDGATRRRIHVPGTPRTNGDAGPGEPRPASAHGGDPGQVNPDPGAAAAPRPGRQSAGRHAHAGTSGGQGPAGDADALQAEVERLQAELEAARRETEAMRTAWQRSAADFQNFRRRSEQEREASLGLASESLLRKLLAVVDDFDRALEAMPAELEQTGWVEGIWLVERKLRGLLDSEGVTAIEAVGQPFDPREHEAVVHQETTEAPDGTVVAELQRGYRLRDRVLRPSLVAVANNTGGRETPEGEH